MTPIQRGQGLAVERSVNRYRKVPPPALGRRCSASAQRSTSHEKKWSPSMRFSASLKPSCGRKHFIDIRSWNIKNFVFKCQVQYEVYEWSCILTGFVCTCKRTWITNHWPSPQYRTKQKSGSCRIKSLWAAWISTGSFCSHSRQTGACWWIHRIWKIS